MRKVIMVTGNVGKWEIAKEVFSQYNLDLVQEKIDTPEIQSYDVEEVSLFSAKYASETLNEPTIKSDVGYYIEALGGFPGPFVKYVNGMLDSLDILEMMKEKPNRTVILKECLAYCEPGKEPVQFISEDKATLALESKGEGSTFDKIVILNGFNEPKAMYDQEENLEYFKKNLKIYHDMAQYLSTNK